MLCNCCRARALQPVPATVSWLRGLPDTGAWEGHRLFQRKKSFVREMTYALLDVLNESQLAPSKPPAAFVTLNTQVTVDALSL